MRALLMYRDRDVELDRPLPDQTEELERDLELPALYDAMADGDPDLRTVARRGLLLPLAEPREIRYRQEVLADCLANPEVVRQLHAVAVDAAQSRRKAHFFWFNDSPDSLLGKSLSMLDLLSQALRQLRSLADAHHERFRSEGFGRLFAEIRRELDDDYLASVDRALGELSFRHGVVMSAHLGHANRSCGSRLKAPRRRRWLQRIGPAESPSHSFSIPSRDEQGARTLADLRGRGIARVASAVAQSTDHVLAYFASLRTELGFYTACLNLHGRLTADGCAVCFPTARPADSWEFVAGGLYDPVLALHLGSFVVGNDLDAPGKRTIVITGANQGGKSTFLRAVGLAQLMLQAGMFVPAESFSAAVRTGVFTHFKREEDASMTHGKLDEELHRMSRIIDHIEPGGMLLCNESFASTNEREGSLLARQLVGGLTRAGVRVVYVTHLYDLAHGLHEEYRDDAAFLRADRNPDGSRPFHLRPAEPLPTSYGVDSFRRIFGTGAVLRGPTPTRPADGWSRGTSDSPG